MITLATSIAPKNLEAQQHAIDSWRRLGFNVLSVNSGEEIDAVKDHFRGVEFIAVDRTSRELTGRSLVYLDDIFRSLVGHGSKISGIVNSDIYLSARDDFRDYLCDNAVGSVVFGARIDVESPQELNGIEYVKGFDVFFFDTDIIRHYPATEFCLGMPWWDYWVPLLPLLRGIPVKQLISPVAFHVRHPLKWDEKYFGYLGCKFLEYLKNEKPAPDGKGLLSLIQDKVRYDHYAVGICVLMYLNAEAEKIVYDDTEFDVVGTAFNYYRQRQGKLDELLIQGMNAMLSHRDGMGWKLTEAMRRLRNSIRQSFGGKPSHRP